MDSDTPPLNKLTVIGVLEIPDNMNSSSSRQARAVPEYSSVVLDAVYISIQVSVISGHLLDPQEEVFGLCGTGCLSISSVTTERRKDAGYLLM